MTETAAKLVTIICNKFHVRMDHITPETTFESLTKSIQEKSELLRHIAEQFKMQILDIEINNIDNVGNALQFIEGSKNFKLMYIIK